MDTRKKILKQSSIDEGDSVLLISNIEFEQDSDVIASQPLKNYDIKLPEPIDLSWFPQDRCYDKQPAILESSSEPCDKIEENKEDPVSSSDCSETSILEEQYIPNLKMYCHICIDGGTVILCDACPKVFHKSCLGIKKIGRNEWKCPYCTGQMIDQCAICLKDLVQQQEKDDVQVKKKRGRPRKNPIVEPEDSKEEVNKYVSDSFNKFTPIKCPLCGVFTHLSCLEIPYWCVTVHDGKNYSVCRCCTESRGIEKFIDSIEGEANTRRRETRKSNKNPIIKKQCMYLAKLCKTSYANCVWMNYELAQELDEDLHNKYLANLKPQDHKKMKPSGIPPRYLQVEKVLAVKIFDGEVKKYYVKWKNLGYNNATWEFPELVKGVPKKEMNKCYGSGLKHLKGIVRAKGSDKSRQEGKQSNNLNKAPPNKPDEKKQINNTHNSSEPNNTPKLEDISKLQKSSRTTRATSKFDSTFPNLPKPVDTPKDESKNPKSSKVPKTSQAKARVSDLEPKNEGAPSGSEPPSPGLNKSKSPLKNASQNSSQSQEASQAKAQSKSAKKRKRIISKPIIDPKTGEYTFETYFDEEALKVLGQVLWGLKGGYQREVVRDPITLSQPSPNPMTQVLSSLPDALATSKILIFTNELGISLKFESLMTKLSLEFSSVPKKKTLGEVYKEIETARSLAEGPQKGDHQEKSAETGLNSRNKKFMDKFRTEEASARVFVFFEHEQEGTNVAIYEENQQSILACLSFSEDYHGELSEYLADKIELLHKNAQKLSNNEPSENHEEAREREKHAPDSPMEKESIIIHLEQSEKDFQSHNNEETKNYHPNNSHADMPQGARKESSEEEKIVTTRTPYPRIFEMSKINKFKKIADRKEMAKYQGSSYGDMNSANHDQPTAQMVKPFRIERVGYEERLKRKKSDIVIDMIALEQDKRASILEYDPSPFYKFEMDMIKKVTNNKFIWTLIEINNDRTEKYCSILGVNRQYQKEFMMFIMRYGWKEAHIESIYKMIKFISRKNRYVTIQNLDYPTFYKFAVKVIEFLKFMNLFKELKDKPHFIFNGNSAEKVMFCIKSTRRLEKMYYNGERNENNCLFGQEEEYFQNLREIQKTYNWNHKDDFILVSCVLNFGLYDYTRISNANRWLKTNEIVQKISCEKGIDNNPNAILKEFGYKMPWESLYQKVFKYDIVSAKRSHYPPNSLKSQMAILKNQLEKFLDQRIKILLNHDWKISE
ncbi:unnamed protein product [Moneuplotes crassus]|uniref:Uncharacterized protein n=1 Tax=Euplotes crassus TaxID=5936 RepID=A0AAD1X7I2_EUPCR|nr:unnamed protein product [Moneuplotes crassus]